MRRSVTPSAVRVTVAMAGSVTCALSVMRRSNMRMPCVATPIGPSVAHPRVRLRMSSRSASISSAKGRRHSLMLVTIEFLLVSLSRTSTEILRTSPRSSGLPMRPTGAHRMYHTSG